MKLLKAIVAVAFVGGSVGAANAVELRNMDTVKHTVRITSPTLDKEYDFRGWTRSLVICVDVCMFDVEGVGKVSANKDDIVTIENGNVTVQAAVAE